MSELPENNLKTMIIIVFHMVKKLNSDVGDIKRQKSNFYRRKYNV